jgi:putative tricarboxylic transport membrane protein
MALQKTWLHTASDFPPLPAIPRIALPSSRIAGADPRKLRLVVNASGEYYRHAGRGWAYQRRHLQFGQRAGDVRPGQGAHDRTISNQRLPLLPDLPTLREQGYDVVASTWFTVFGPKGISPLQAAYWEDVFSKAMRHPEAKKFAETNNWTIDLIGSKELPALLDK